MRIVNSCILELREYQGKRVVCQLKLDCPAGGEVNIDGQQSFHWLEKQHWQNFDAQLEQLIDNLPDKTRSRNEVVENFQLHDELEVQVTNSTTSVKTLLDCLGHLTLGRKENTLALDFMFLRRPRKKYSKPNPEDLINEVCTDIAEDLEYHPQPVSSILISPDSSSLSYVPSKIGWKNSEFGKTTEPNISGGDDEDRYSPTFQSKDTLPVYTPKPINKEKDIFANSSEDDDYNVGDSKFAMSEMASTTIAKDCSTIDEQITKIRTSSEPQDSSPDVLLIKSQEEKCLNSEKNIRTRRQYHKHARQIKNVLAQKEEEKPKHRLLDIEENENDTLYIKIGEKEKESQDDNIDLDKYVKLRKDKAVKVSAEKGKRKTERTSPDLKTAATTLNQGIELRRSKRSPVKNLRYEVDDSRAVKSTHISKKRSNTISKTMQECFGSDAESDDFVEKTPIKAAPKIQLGSAQLASSSVKKRKRNEKNERDCQQEKQSLSKWLSKKKPEELVTSPKKATKSEKSRLNETKARDTYRSSSTIKRIVYPTPEEIATNERREKEQMKVNRKMKVLLEDLIQVPKKIEILSLNSMSADEILNTFPKYKYHLDGIFNKLRSKPKVTGYNGINHYSVIELIDNEKQLKIMNKLGEVYENECEGTSMYSTLFANALMPEWLVNVFKDKYKFSHSEAVLRLHDQQQYMQYMDVEDQH